MNKVFRKKKKKVESNISEQIKTTKDGKCNLESFFYKNIIANRMKYSTKLSQSWTNSKNGCGSSFTKIKFHVISILFKKTK